MRRIFLAALLATGVLVALPAAPAVAHGDCHFHINKPTFEQNDLPYGARLAAHVEVDCDNGHDELHVKGYLQAKRAGVPGWRRVSFANKTLNNASHIGVAPDGNCDGDGAVTHVYRSKMDFFYAVNNPGGTRVHEQGSRVGTSYIRIDCRPRSWSSLEVDTDGPFTDESGASTLGDVPAYDDFERNTTTDNLGNTSVNSKTWQNDVSANNWGIVTASAHGDNDDDNTDEGTKAAQFINIDGGGTTATSYVYINSGVTDVTDYAATSEIDTSTSTFNVGLTLNHGASQYAYCIAKKNATYPDGVIQIGGKLDSGSEAVLQEHDLAGDVSEPFNPGDRYSLMFQRFGNTFTCSIFGEFNAAGERVNEEITWTGTSTDTDGLTSGRAGLRIRKNSTSEDQGSKFLDFEVNE